MAREGRMKPQTINGDFMIGVALHGKDAIVEGLKRKFFVG